MAGRPVDSSEWLGEPLPRRGRRARRRSTTAPSARTCRARPHRRRLRRPEPRGLQRDARASPGPTSSPACTTRSSTSASTWSRPPRFGAFAVAARPSTASPTRPTSSTWPPPASPARWPTRLDGDRAASPARSARAPSRRPSARSASPTCATPTRSRPRACSRAASTCSSSRRSSTCCRPRRRCIGCRRAMAAAGREVPLQVQVTMETHRAHAARHRDRRRPRRRSTRMRPDVIGLNCATGPAEMSEHLRYLVPALAACRSRACPTPACRRSSTARCTTTSRPSSWPTTTPASSPSSACRSSAAAAAPRPSTSRQVVEAVPRPRRRRRARRCTSRARTSIYTPGAVRPGHSFLIDRRAHQRQRLEEVPRRDARRRLGHVRRRWPREQVKEGAHVLDVCVDYVGRDGTVDMDEIASRFATQASVPLVLDSTEPQVHGGRPAVDRRPGHPQLGQPRGRRARPAPGSTACSRWPASTAPPSSACCIDEEGQARDVEWKMRVAHRIHDIAVERYGLEPSDLIFDALTFPLSTGDEDLRGDAHGHHRGHPPHQGRAARRATPRSACPTCRSASSPPARHVLNSVFLHECVEAGLDSAIVHAGADHAAQPHPRRAARGLPRPHLRPARRRRLRPAAGAARRCSPTSTRRRRSRRRTARGWPVERAAEAAHHRRRPRRPRGRPRRGARRRHSAARASSTTCCSTA